MQATNTKLQAGAQATQTKDQQAGCKRQTQSSRLERWQCRRRKSEIQCRQRQVPDPMQTKAAPRSNKDEGRSEIQCRQGQIRDPMQTMAGPRSNADDEKPCQVKCDHHCASDKGDDSFHSAIPHNAILPSRQRRGRCGGGQTGPRCWSTNTAECSPKG